MPKKIKLVSGSLAPLQDQKELNVEFTYDHLNVGKENEEDYVKRRTADYNSKEPGKGDTWAKAWVADRKERFEPKFGELFNENGDLKAGSYPSAKYTMVFHTTFIEPGFNVGITRKNSYIDAEITIVETVKEGSSQNFLRQCAWPLLQSLCPLILILCSFASNTKTDRLCEQHQNTMVLLP